MWPRTQLKIGWDDLAFGLGRSLSRPDRAGLARRIEEFWSPAGDALVFAQDYAFSSPSTAAGVVLGRSANGRTEWKDQQGRTLKAIQEATVPPDGSTATEIL